MLVSAHAEVPLLLAARATRAHRLSLSLSRLLSLFIAWDSSPSLLCLSYCAACHSLRLLSQQLFDAFTNDLVLWFDAKSD